MGTVGTGYAAVPGRHSQKPGGRGKGQLVQEPLKQMGAFREAGRAQDPQGGTGCG